MFIAYFYLLTQKRLTGKTHWYWYVLVSRVRQKTAHNTLETGTEKTKSDISDNFFFSFFFLALYSMCVFVSVWTARFCRGSTAMENWGCVTYREARLLVNEATSSTATKKAIARTVCHELAHQWFGNLVIMK